MNTLNEFTKSLNAKTDTAYGLIRIFLGIALAVRGWMILSNPDSIIELGLRREFFIWVTLIGIAHFVGGVLLFLGFFVRLGALIQIPILFIAAFFVHEPTKLMNAGQSLELAYLVLFLLCIYFIFGSGTLSLSDYFAKSNLSSK